MKLLQINGGIFGSTGRIMFSIEELAQSFGFETLSCAPVTEHRKSDKNFFIIESFLIRKINAFLDYIFGTNGCFSYFSTKRLIKRIKEFNPNIIHIHTIHGGYINIKLFTKFLKKTNAKIVWTFHDCWPFTGRCPYFDIYNCNNWKTGCKKCPYSKSEYPRVLFNKSSKMWKLKNQCFSNIPNLLIVTPSMWLEQLTKQSFFAQYPSVVINNGIDLNDFKPTESDLKKRYSLNDEDHLVLGVSFAWGKRKGLDVFNSLAKRLPDNYRIMLVGTNSSVDSQLDKRIISLHRTDSQIELAKIYTAADVFVNPTREDNYPTVNMESLACGTPVLTFKTGGSPEMVDSTCGNVIDCDDIESLEKEIIRTCENKPYSQEECLKKSRDFESKAAFVKYIDLYKKILH